MNKDCIYCLISAGKVQSAKIYEDEQIIAFLDINPATKGHLQVIPKKHAPLMRMLPEVLRSKLFNTAVSLGNGLLEKLNATGISYIINEGQGAGQEVPHASIHVIPRYEDDNVSISWKEKEMNQEEVSEYLTSVINKLRKQDRTREGKGRKKIKKVQERTGNKSKEGKEDEEEEVVEVEERIPRYW